MTFKQYGVDVASYQPGDVSGYHSKGADFCIVKLTQGTSYTNPLARYQVASSRKGHMYTHAYHYAEFGSSVSKAKAEAQFFVKVAKQANIDIAKSRYLWLDYEDGNGNTVHGDKAANTAAIIAFMDTVKKAGFKTGLYSGAYVLKTNIDYKQVVKKFGTCLWVASYPTDDAVSTANFGYFPSLDGVAIWQFTSHYHGLSLDGNVAVVDLHKKTTPKKTKSASTWVKKKGAFTLKTPLHLHKEPKITAGNIAELKAGDVVNFDAILHGPKRVWLRQPRSGGKYGYIVAQDKYGKATGKIKYKKG
jgi:GH25 family lysozyme M1 (1,4-beta-N-acetylmuramidase)